MRIDALPTEDAAVPVAPSPAFTDFSGAMAYMQTRTDLERLRPSSDVKDQYRLDRMFALMQALGNPQNDVRTVHVAGTKGKGSICEMTATCLETCGYTVGIFTSPHLLNVRERIRINRAMVSEAEFARLARRCVDAAIEIEPRLGPATFFELLTAMAFVYFAEQAVDIGVIEVGLGGLLDCTNIITPEVCAVGMIGFDHTQILGDTLEEIAAQKAGIFKPGVPALTFEQDEKILTVLKNEAQRIGAPLQVVGQDIDFTYRSEFVSGLGGGPTQRVHLASQRFDLEHVTVPLKGEHQAMNCGLALAIVDKLCERGLHCSAEKIVEGIEATTLEGRFELVVRSPRIVVDGAHNPESIRALMRTLSAHMQYDSLVVVFGCAADKDFPLMLRHLAAGADKVIFTRATGNARAATPGELARKYHEVSGGKMLQTARDFEDAMELGLRAVTRDDVLCVCGSFYIAGEAKRWLNRKLASKSKK